VAGIQREEGTCREGNDSSASWRGGRFLSVKKIDGGGMERRNSEQNK